MMRETPDERVKGPTSVNISDGFGGRELCWVWKPWRWLTIFHQVATEVGENSHHISVCWEKLGIVLSSCKQGARNLMEIFGSPTSFGDDWSGPGSVGTHHIARAGSEVAGRNNWPGTNACWRYLVRGLRLLGKFGRSLCPFRIFGWDRHQLRTSMPQPRSREGCHLMNT